MKAFSNLILPKFEAMIECPKFFTVILMLVLCTACQKPLSTSEIKVQNLARLYQILFDLRENQDWIKD